MVQNAPYSIEINVLEQIVFLELCPIFDGSLHHLSDRYEKNSPQCKMALMHMGAKKRKKIGFPRPNLVVNLSSCPVAIINAIFKYLILSHDFLTILCPENLTFPKAEREQRCPRLVVVISCLFISI